MIKIKSIAAGLYMAVAASSLIFSAPAYSVVIGYDWTGTVTSPGAASATVSVGDAISGSFFYDTAAIKSSLGSGSGQSFTNYFNPDAGVAIDFSVGGFTGSAGSPSAGFVVGINTSPGKADFFNIGSNSATGITVGGVTPSTFSLRLTDSTGTVYSASVPPAPPPGSLTFGDFDSSLVQINFTGGTGNTLSATIDTLTLAGSSGSPVPEPATLALFGLGLAGLGLLRRRRAA